MAWDGLSVWRVVAFAAAYGVAVGAAGGFLTRATPWRVGDL